MTKHSKKRQKELKRRLGQGQHATQVREARAERLASAQARLAEELGDPERVAQHLQTFAQLALVVPRLHPVRLPGAELVQTLLELELPEEGTTEERERALRQAVLPTFVRPELLEQLDRTLDAALGQAESEPEFLAVMAARALLLSSRQLPPAQQPLHPFWELVFDLSLTEALLSGHFLIRLVLERRCRPEPAAVSQTFAKVLAQGQLAAELEPLGLEEQDPGKLAQAYCELVQGEDSYHVEYDAVLHLSGLHIAMAETLGRVMSRVGPTPRLQADVLALYEEAYAQDVTPTLVDELSRWFRRRLEVIRDQPPEGISPEALAEEKRRSLLVLFALKALPREESHLLRSIHVRSLILSRLRAPEAESPFVERLWSAPGDAYALEEYERFLRERNQLNRASRVHAYLGHVRQAKQELARRLEAVRGREAGPEEAQAGAGEAQAPAS